MAWDTETEKYAIHDKWNESVLGRVAQGLLNF